MSNTIKQQQLAKEEVAQEEAAEEEESQPNDKNEPKEEAEEKKMAMPDDERILWTAGGQLKLPCVDGCDGVLENDVYGQLVQTMGLPRKMKCHNANCDSLLQKRLLSFYCPKGDIKDTNHVGMVWCRFCAYQKARAVHKKYVRYYNLRGEEAKFDRSVIMYGFGSIEGLR